MLHTLRDALTELRVAMRILENDPELWKLFPDPLAQFNAPSNTGELLRALCSAYAPLKEGLRELGAVLDRQPLSRVSWDR